MWEAASWIIVSEASFALLRIRDHFIFSRASLPDIPGATTSFAAADDTLFYLSVQHVVETLPPADDGDHIADFFSCLKRDLAASQKSVLRHDDEEELIL